MKKIKKASCGLVLLEYALAAAAVMPLLLLATDAANVFRARNALQESVKRTLRCLSPVDADCLKTSTANSTARYQVNLLETQKRWPIEMFNFEGEASWLALPQYRYANPIVRTLDRVTYKTRALEAFRTEETLKHSIRVNYQVMTANGPYVETGSNAESSLQPNFVFSRARNKSYPYHTKNIRHVRGSTKEVGLTQKIGTTNFTVPKVDLSLCFHSKRIGYKNDHKANFKKPCAKEYIPVVLHIQGEFPADHQAEGSHGKVLINLRGQDFQITPGNRSQYNLGGRAFEYNSRKQFSASFVPRGSKNISAKNNYREFDLYKQILLKPGNSYNLDFFLKRTSRAATKTRWQGKEFKLFFPQFIRGKTKLECKDSSCKQIKLGNQLVPQKFRGKKFTETKQIRKSLGCFFSAPDCSDCKIEASARCKGERTIVQTCPKNYGTKGKPEQICPIKVDQDFLLGSPRYYEKDSTLAASFDYTRESCMSPQVAPKDSYPDEVKKYAKLIRWGSVRRIQDKIKTTAQIDPQELVKKNPEYACPDVSIKRKKLYQRDSLFQGTHSLLTTGCNWEEALKTEGIRKFKLDPNIFFKAEREFAGINYMNVQPDIACYNLLPQVSATNLGSPLGIFGKDSIPAICNEAKYACELELIGFDKVEDSEISINHTRAVEAGLDTFKAVFPNADLCTEGNNCFNMQINFDGESFYVEANTHLPLLAMLGKTHLNIKKSAEAYWEGKYLSAQSSAGSKFR